MGSSVAGIPTSRRLDASGTPAPSEVAAVGSDDEVTPRSRPSKAAGKRQKALSCPLYQRIEAAGKPRPAR